MDCGHCFQRDKQGTRYEETNNHAQCRGCNGDRKTRGQQTWHKQYIRQNYGENELLRLEYLSQKLVVQRRDEWYLEKIEEYKNKLEGLNG